MKMTSKLAIALLIAGLLSFGAWSSHGQTGKERNVTYEYAVIEDPTYTMDHDEAVKKLNELGAHGWEIVVIKQVPSGCPWLYLKRTIK
jgi:hypothetical protein